MRKFKLLSKALCLSTAMLTGTSLISITSCNKNNYDTDKLFFEVKAGDITATFCDRGAAMYSIKYKDTYVTYHPKNKADFLRDDYYHGKVVGRVAGRIKDGKFKVGDKDYQVEVNEISETKYNTLHGGNNGLNTKDWTRSVSEDKTKKTIDVKFTYHSPAMEAGFPEDVDVTVTYTLHTDKAWMDTKITATTTSSNSTPINITTHPYFRLANDGNILNHTLKINADERSYFENELTGTNQIVEAWDKVGNVSENKHSKAYVYDETEKKVIEKTPWDFNTEAKAIGKDVMLAKALDPVSNGYDHIWKKSDASATNQLEIELKNSANNYTLNVTSPDADAVIIYVNCYPHKGVEVNPSGVDTLYSGMTVEPIKAFDKTQESINKLMINKDQPFERNFTYKFSTK